MSQPTTEQFLQQVTGEEMNRLLGWLASHCRDKPNGETAKEIERFRQSFQKLTQTQNP